MKAADAFEGISRYFAFPAGVRTGVSAAGWVFVIGIAYFLASRLGLSLLVAPSDVAVFWPASGIAAGILITFGRRELPALAIGVMVGTVAANLLSDRSLPTSMFKGLCNIGEPIMATPAVVGGVLYVRTASALFAFGGK